MMKKTLVTLLLIVCALAPVSAAVADTEMADTEMAETTAAQRAFDQLKGLEGTWTGTPEGHGAEAEAEAEHAGEVVHEFRLSAAGTVVMETMGPGTPHEMINMYHIDGDDLVLTHYCAGGNQPTMRLDMESSSDEKMVFDFTGGTNFDPAVDQHIHAAQVTLLGEGKLESVWTAYAGGKEVAKMVFHLSRAE